MGVTRLVGTLFLVCGIAGNGLANETSRKSDEQPWLSDTPESQGVDASRLREIFEFVGKHGTPIHSVLILRNDRVILDATFYPYDGSRPHDVASVTKSITATLVEQAIEAGALPSLDTRLEAVLPSHSHDSRATPSEATLRELLSMRSGIDCAPDDEASNLRMRSTAHWADEALSRGLQSKPGTTFKYCSAGIHLLAAALAHGTGMSPEAFAKGMLFTQLSISDFIWPADPDGVNYGWGDLHMRPVDMAKIGSTYLHRGEWQRQRILSSRWVLQATTPQSDLGYGLGWWVHEDVAGGLFEAEGRGGQRISVLPKLNLVVVMTGGGFEAGDIGKIILDSVKSSEPLPENPAADAELQAAAVHARMARELFREKMRAELPDGGPSSAGPYSLKPNGFGMKTVELWTDGSGGRQLTVCFIDDSCLRVPATGDGAEHEGHQGRFGMTTVSASIWHASNLNLWVDEVENVNAWRATLEFAPDRVRMCIASRGKAGCSEISGHTSPSD